MANKYGIMKKCIYGLVLAMLVVFNSACMKMGEPPKEKTFVLTSLQTQYSDNPIGLDLVTPVFSWKMESNLVGAKQTAYQIKVADPSKEVVWDSGKVDNSGSVAIPYEGAALKGETDYIWEVTVWNQDGKTASAEAKFSTGLMGNWDGAQWIVPKSQKNGAPMLRTKRDLKGDVASAKLYITSLGVYEAYINGNEVKISPDVDDVFTPGWTDYKSYVHYQTYDVTDYVNKSDKVALGVMLGNGWYGVGRDPLIKSTATGYAMIGDPDVLELALLAKLVITYADGSKEVIVTNKTDWKSSDNSPVIYNNNFVGEEYDATLEEAVAGWTLPGFNDTGWDGVSTLNYPGDVQSSTNAQNITAFSVADRQYPQMDSVDTFVYSELKSYSDLELGEVIREPVDMSNNGDINLPKGKTLIVDMGQNMVGVMSLTVSGPEGTTVQLRHAEMLNDGRAGITKVFGSDGPKGTLYRSSLLGIFGMAEQRDRYTLNNEAAQVYRPHFTYHGFRYVEITADSDIVIHSLFGEVITSATRRTGFIETSDPNVNKLFSNTLWSQRGNYLSIPTDCPQRSERLGWTGDAQLFAETAMYNFDVTNFLRNYVEMLNDYNENNDGRYGITIPFALDLTKMMGQVDVSGWSDAGVIIPWAIYQQTGDVSIIRNSYPYMDKYMDKIGSLGYSKVVFGDWVGFNPAGVPILNVLYRGYTAKLMSEMADTLNLPDKKQKYDTLFEETKADFINTYVDEDGNILSTKNTLSPADMWDTPFVDNAQTAILWALKLGFYQSEGMKDTFVKNLIASIRNENGAVRPGQPENTLGVGFLGVNVILPVLSEVGYSNVAYDLLLQDKLPSWLYSVKNGATTIWERWNSYSTEDSFANRSMNSFNHYSYGAVVEWMYEDILGINAAEPGFKKILLTPMVDESGRITYAKGSFESAYGMIESNWTADDGVLTSYSVVVPANTSATLYLPVELAEDAVSTTGVKYVGNVIYNGKSCAVFELDAGGYDFTIKDGVVTVYIQD